MNNSLFNNPKDNSNTKNERLNSIFKPPEWYLYKFNNNLY